MSLFARTSRVFVYPAPIDMRSGFEKLSGLIRTHFQAEVSHGHLYVFLGRNRRRLKILFFDGSGLLLVTKRMEKHAFMAVEELQGRTEITRRELKLVLHGSVLRVYSPDESEKKVAA